MCLIVETQHCFNALNALLAVFDRMSWAISKMATAMLSGLMPRLKSLPPMSINKMLVVRHPAWQRGR